jgi:integrase
VLRQHALLHAALGRAVKWGMIASNPADRATPPALTRQTVTTPSLADVQRLIAAAEAGDDPILATAIALGAVTGARRGELCALRWSDVDWERRLLRVARSLTVIRHEVSEGPTKTHQVRQVAIDEVMGAFLLVRRGQQESYAAHLGVPICADPYLLSRSADGSAPCLPDGLSHGYERLAKRLGVVGHLHELRHFAATTAIAGGTDVRTVAGRLGHAGPSITLRMYARALEARDRELAGMLGSAVLGAMNGSAKPYEADPPAPPQLESTGYQSPRKSRGTDAPRRSSARPGPGR